MPLDSRRDRPPRRGRLGGRFDGLGADRSSSGDGPSWWRVTGAALALIALVGLGVWAWLISRKSRVLADETTLCPTDRPVTEVDVMLLDLSDKLTDIQRLQITNELERVREKLPRFALLEAYAVQGTAKDIARPLIHLCNPGRGRDMSPIYQNPTLAEQRWKTAFSERLTSELSTLTDQPENATSPIYEAIQAIAVRTFAKADYDEIPKRLIVFSDLLQNVPGKQSQYRSLPQFAEFKTTPYYASIRANLDHVQVDVYYLSRPNSTAQGVEHIRFWEQYFAAQGASLRTVERIFGDR
jgi:hypothetical protein